MDVSHQQVVIANLGYQAAAFGAPMNGDELADFVAAADARLGALPLVL